MYRLESENPFVVIGNPPLSDIAQYINPHLKTTRVQNAIGNHIQGFQRKPSKPDTYKTVMCQAWLESMKCSFGENCKFAHGEQELRPAKTQIRNHLKYKTKLCEKYTTSGICPYGSRCLFIHPTPPIKSADTSSVSSTENISPVNILLTMEHPTSPTNTSIHSIWSSNSNFQPHQCQFNKNQRLPIRTAVVGSPLHGAAATDIIDSSLLFNQTAEAMVSFLWA